MGSWCMELSDYMGGWCRRKLNSMGGWCRRKLNSMGGWVKKKVPSSPHQVFFSGIALMDKQIFILLYMFFSGTIWLIYSGLLLQYLICQT